MVGPRAEVPVFGTVVADNVVVSRHPPNQPYFTHDVVGASDVDVEDSVELVDVVVVDVSSRHPTNVNVCKRTIIERDHIPHHPGVLHVSVLVGDAVEELLLLDVIPSEPLLAKYFQLKQSTHSSSGMHAGTSS